LKAESEAGIENAKRVLADIAKQNEKYKATLEKEAKRDSTKTTIKTPTT
jgi:outer membrane protein assembly factor BamD